MGNNHQPERSLTPPSDATTLADDRTRVLKDGELFALFDRFGDIHGAGSGVQGIYFGGTRHLSNFELLVDGERPVLLSSTVKDDNLMMVADFTNPDRKGGTGDHLQSDTVHIRRRKFLHRGSCYECIELRSFQDHPLQFDLRLRFAADFADIFEVRGKARSARGKLRRETVDAARAKFSYHGLDEVVRTTQISIEPMPLSLTELDGNKNEVRFDLRIEARASKRIFIRVNCDQDTVPEQKPNRDLASCYESAQRDLEQKLREVRLGSCRIFSSNELLNRWLTRSFSDLHMLITEKQEGPFPYAGIPWFSTAFGRDGIITALECLAFAPEISKGVLLFLAKRQATKKDPRTEAEPGKILHETRLGEMATLFEVPFAQYYGSIDSTPLFALLAGAYFRRTGDLSTLRELWPAIKGALAWCQEYGDRDQDGYIEYGRGVESGLIHQGWKDSTNPIFHNDGKDAPLPIALCEVQAYWYGALHECSHLANVLGETEYAKALQAQADALSERFNRDFWLPSHRSYALALDGDKKACEVRSSNAGQCLFTGIVPHDRAALIAAWLVESESHSGWGVRTIPRSESRYNPMSYHNGSIWPHDNALVALGLSKVGQKRAALQIFNGLFAAANDFDQHRLPEVFCGFGRQPGEAPTLYPVACAPQAWAAGSVFLLLQSLLGLEVCVSEAAGNNKAHTLCFREPLLPESVEWLRIENLDVCGAVLSLHLTRHQDGVGIEVLQRSGEVEVLVAK